MIDNLIKLHESKLWKTYKKKKPSVQRIAWLESTYEKAVSWLKLVPNTFPNYTLHDETHVLNVMEAMAGLLGNQIGSLSLGECELLILSAALHDIGMVYTDKTKKEEGHNKHALDKFLRDNAPEYFGLSFDNLPNDKKQDYLRTRHPFRIAKVLNMTIPGKEGEEEKTWGFETMPSEIVPKEVIIDVCQSHGEGQKTLESSRLKYLPTIDVDPRFCALLLRLGDILDFDGSRAPEILSVFAEGIKRSEEAYDKHGASGGFTFPRTPSDKELKYRAKSDEPNINFKLHSYLDWVDQELLLASSIIKLCNERWRDFPFPRSIARKEILCSGFDSAPFSVTMDQEQILTILTGENLYKDKSIFIRELLQNAIDATLLRGKMDRSFNIESEKAAIYFWSGMDKNSNLILRIDDSGIGMTRGMLRKFFLKVGKSYYQSEEIKRDLIRHEVDGEYHSISRFGIGFLSCFLCGRAVEVSTLYFDEQKCQDENDYEGDAESGFGLRAEIPGLTGYYAIHNQALKHHIREELPFPTGVKKDLLDGLEYDGYRQYPGTSIVVTLEPCELGIIDLKKALEKYLCAPRMPVYFNGERIGCTYREMMAAAHKLAGTTIYNLSAEEKQEFNKLFPEAKQMYPQLALTVSPLDSLEFPRLSGFSGVVIKRALLHDDTPKWKVKDQEYQLKFEFEKNLLGKYNSNCIPLSASQINCAESSKNMHWMRWSDIKNRYGFELTDQLIAAFDKYEICPESETELGDIWLPFSEELRLDEAWTAYVDYCAGKDYFRMDVPAFHAAPLLSTLMGNPHCGETCISYHGVYAGTISKSWNDNSTFNDALFYLEGNLPPETDIGRTKIIRLSLETELNIRFLAYHLALDHHAFYELPHPPESALSYRKLRNTAFGQMIMQKLSSEYSMLKHSLEQPLYQRLRINKEQRISWLLSHLGPFLKTALQDEYEITVCYENGMRFSFASKNTVYNNLSTDNYPPFLFCHAASEVSRRYLCAADVRYRDCLTADHPFSKWLLQQESSLQTSFPGLFDEILNYLFSKNVRGVIDSSIILRKFFNKLGASGKTSIPAPPVLEEDDFWSP